MKQTRAVVVAEIVVEEGLSAGLRARVERFPALIGRGEDADVRLEDDPDDPTLSRRHVCVTLAGGRLSVQDVSTNGTWLGDALMEPQRFYQVGRGLVLWLGPHVRIRVRALQEGASPPAISGQRADPSPSPPCARLIELQTFGSFKCRVDGREVPASAWESRKAILLFVFLAERVGQPQLFERLYEALWPASEEVSRQALQATISRIRKAVRTVLDAAAAAAILHGDRAAYMIPESWTVRSDVTDFEAALERAGDAVALRAALRLYGGPFLAGHADEWTQRRRTWLERRANEATERLGALLEAQSEHTEALALYGGLLERAPTHEGGHAGAMRCLVAMGRRDEARRQYQDCVRTLRRHLDVEPGPELQTLYASLI